jgi:hypothetical protein
MQLVPWSLHGMAVAPAQLAARSSMLQQRVDRACAVHTCLQVCGSTVRAAGCWITCGVCHVANMQATAAVHGLPWSQLSNPSGECHRCKAALNLHTAPATRLYHVAYLGMWGATPVVLVLLPRALLFERVTMLPEASGQVYRLISQLLPCADLEMQPPAVASRLPLLGHTTTRCHVSASPRSQLVCKTAAVAASWWQAGRCRLQQRCPQAPLTGRVRCRQLPARRYGSTATLTTCW